jgi:hypothetical protein
MSQKAEKLGKEDYKRFKRLKLPGAERWEKGVDHHSESIRLMSFLMEHDLNDYNDFFCWKWGGDGDNGESLMFEMDAYFESRDREMPKTKPPLTKPMSKKRREELLEDACNLGELLETEIANGLEDGEDAIKIRAHLKVVREKLYGE